MQRSHTNIESSSILWLGTAVATVMLLLPSPPLFLFLSVSLCPSTLQTRSSDGGPEPRNTHSWEGKCS